MPENKCKLCRHSLADCSHQLERTLDGGCLAFEPAKNGTDCMHKKAENPYIGCVKYEKWKPRQPEPEPEKRVFEGNPFDPRDLSDWYRLQHVFLEDCYREFRMKPIRITVEVLK